MLMCGNAEVAPMEATLTIDPRPLARKAPNASRTSSKWLKQLTCMIRSKFSRVACSRVPGPNTPATLQTESIPSNFARVLCTKPLSVSSSHISPVSASSRGSWRARSATVFSSSAPLLSMTPTRAPCSSRSSVVALPTPLAPPVTSTTLPSFEIMSHFPLPLESRSTPSRDLPAFQCA